MAVRFDLELMTEEARELEFAHQGMCELIEGIRQDDHLGATFEPLEEIFGTRKWPHSIDDFLNLRQCDPMLVENVEPILHQLVIIWLLACGASQCFDTGSLGYIDPDFRYENPFEVKTCDHGASVRQHRRRLNR